MSGAPPWSLNRRGTSPSGRYRAIRLAGVASSIYVFGLDTYGYTLFSGYPYSQWYGVIAPELNDHLDGPFGGRDVVSVADAFGETFLYYSTRNPASGMLQRKVTFVKRVVVYGLPILVGSGYYHPDEGLHVPGRSRR